MSTYNTNNCVLVCSPGLMNVSSSGIATTPSSALCEILDNAIDWNAKNINIYRNNRENGNFNLCITNDGDPIDDLQRVAIPFSTVKQKKIGKWGAGLTSIPGTFNSSLHIMSDDKELTIHPVNAAGCVSDISCKRKDLCISMTGNYNKDIVYVIITDIKDGLLSNDEITSVIQNTYIGQEHTFYLNGVEIMRAPFFTPDDRVVSCALYEFNVTLGGTPVLYDDGRKMLLKSNNIITQEFLIKNSWKRYVKVITYKKLSKDEKKIIDEAILTSTSICTLACQLSKKELVKNGVVKKGGIYVSINTNNNDGKRILNKCDIPYNNKESSANYGPYALKSVCLLSADASNLNTTANKSAVNNLDTYIKNHTGLFAAIMKLINDEIIKETNKFKKAKMSEEEGELEKDNLQNEHINNLSHVVADEEEFDDDEDEVDDDEEEVDEDEETVDEDEETVDEDEEDSNVINNNLSIIEPYDIRNQTAYVSAYVRGEVDTSEFCKTLRDYANNVESGVYSKDTSVYNKIKSIMMNARGNGIE
jgi:hypothetical protein